MALVQICLATYNGEKYLRQQLESILLCTGDFELIIHDDGSSDGTRAIIYEFSSRYKNIKILNAPSKGGAKSNFSFLLENSTAPYIMCSDQDDIWLPNKIENLLKNIQNLEEKFGNTCPLLVHCNLKLIDHIDQEISSSFWKYQNLDPRWSGKLNLTLSQNVVTGCALMVNRALLQMALPIPRDAVMHDWWLSLVAAAFGKVAWESDPLVLYRQHSNNEVGAKRFNLKNMLLKFHKILIKGRPTENYAQAYEFYIRYKSSDSGKTALEFSNLSRIKYFKRWKKIRENKFYKIGIFRNFAWIWLS